MAPPHDDRDRDLRFSRRTMLNALGGAAVAGTGPDPGLVADAQEPPPDPLAPVALDGSAAQAYASHKARANGLAWHFARTRPLTFGNERAGEDSTVALIAHAHAVTENPDFDVDGKRSRDEIPLALRRLNRGNGLVGTTLLGPDRDYDMALKGLVVLAYRYPSLLGDGGVDYIIDQLFPENYGGGHPPAIEIAGAIPNFGIYIPETENHLLMIESSRYLLNQLLLKRTGDRRYNNVENGLHDWLLGYMHTIARHDFLEFNSRPYARLALHALLNLHEFARDDQIRTAAQMLLDYTMMKFALSSSRGRRVSPFRRQQHRINHAANERNYLYASSGEEVAGYFMAYTGYTGPGGEPSWFPVGQDFTGLLGATAAYRPPPAAYIVALEPDHPAYLHRIHHGTRPELPGGEPADGGLEIYYRSPSFLLSAGGQFLNSGYGSDEIDIGKEAWEQTSRAQATTLIPTRADTLFHDLIRFEPYPDPLVDPYADDPEDPDCYHTQAVNIGVGRGLIAGANLRPAEKKTVLEVETSRAPALAPHGERLFAGWTISTFPLLQVAKVEDTSVLDIDGVEGVEHVATLAIPSGATPTLASHSGRLFLSWKGFSSTQLGLAYSEDNGATFVGEVPLPESSDYGPALTSHNGRLFLAWTGRGNEQLNVSKVALFANTAGGFGIEGLEEKIVLDDTSETPPALASHNGRLFLAWKGSDNDNLSLAFSDDNGLTFRGKKILPETSSHGPALASHEGGLFLAWKGSGNESLNVARVVLFGNTAGGFGIEGLEDKVVLDEISTEPPSLASHNGQLFLGWKGEGDDNLNLRVSRDGSFQAPGPWIIKDLGERLGFYLAAYRAPVSRPDDLDPVPDNLGFVYAMEATEMSFDQFRGLIEERNRGLPAQLEYGSSYEFEAPDGKRFSIWFVLIEQKYQARVVELTDPNAITDLSTLPLVDGPYLTAPGGHDGLLEIRHPGCEQWPVVLDFRTAQDPVRRENTVECPEPWTERVQALSAIARRFDEQGRTRDAQTARADAGQLYDELVRLNPGQIGPQLAPTVIEALASMGVDFSVPEAELRDWLANPEFTPYPAIAQALLRSGWRLKSPVYLDVIVFNYEERSDGPSPRVAGDVNVDVLKAAILEGYNVRYGTTVTEFPQILLP